MFLTKKYSQSGMALCFSRLIIDDFFMSLYSFGYPDPTYLVRVTEELREKGITADWPTKKRTDSSRTIGLCPCWWTLFTFRFCSVSACHIDDDLRQKPDETSILCCRRALISSTDCTALFVFFCSDKLIQRHMWKKTETVWVHTLKPSLLATGLTSDALI